MRIFIPCILVILSFSCTHSGEEIKPEQSNLPPQMNFIYDYGYIHGNDSVQIGSEMNIGIIAIASDSLKKLSRFVISKTRNDSTVVILDSLLNDEAFEFREMFFACEEKAVEIWNFEIYDSDSLYSSMSIDIYTEPFPPIINYVLSSIYLLSSEKFILGLNIEVNENSEALLSKIRIRRNVEGEITYVLDTLVSAYKFRYFKQYKAVDFESTEFWDVIAIDKNGIESIETFRIVTTLYIENEYYGEVYNALNIENCAFDLMNNSALSIDDEDAQKDLQNTTEAEFALPPYYFENVWMAKNSTLYRRANTYNYEQATLQAAIDAYSGGTPSVVPNPFATSLSENDIYIAKLRGTDKYAVIKILSVEWTEYDNLDKITFSYKK